MVEGGTPVFFNGKFYSGGMNGVHRVSDRLIREFDRKLAELPLADRPEAFLMAPRTSTWLPDLEAVQLRTFDKTNQFWEQLTLPWLTRKGTLINLANLAPVMHGRKVTMIHDIQFLMPDCGYSMRQRFGYRTLAPLIGRSSRRVLTVSEFSRNMLSDKGISKKASTGVIHNGANHILDVKADHDILPLHGLAPLQYVVMFASPKPYKNIRVVLDAFAQPELAKTQLVLVGSSRNGLETAGLSVPANTVFTGPIEDGALKALLQSAVAIAFPSRTEGFGLPPLEAMLCDCPVIANAGGAIPEVCGQSVQYAGADQPRDWVQAILRFSDDLEYRADFIDRGRTRAARFTWSSAGQLLYDTVVQVSGNYPSESVASL